MRLKEKKNTWPVQWVIAHDQCLGSILNQYHGSRPNNTEPKPLLRLHSPSIKHRTFNCHSTRQRRGYGAQRGGNKLPSPYCTIPGDQPVYRVSLVTMKDLTARFVPKDGVANPDYATDHRMRGRIPEKPPKLARSS